MVHIKLGLSHYSGDIISRTAFGSSYEEGKKILKLQKELQVLVMEAMQTLYVPGFRTLVEKKDRAITAGESKNDDLLGLLLQSKVKVTIEVKVATRSRKLDHTESLSFSDKIAVDVELDHREGSINTESLHND
ncbi:hypothetical protein AgCh_016862 [Apium graveolens]